MNKLNQRIGTTVRSAIGSAIGSTIVTAIVVGVSLSVGVLQSGRAEAQVGTTACGEEREVEPGLMTEGTYRRLNEAVELMGEEKFNESVAELEKLRNSRLSDYEMATVHQYLGFLAAQRERYENAIEHFREAIRLDKMPNQTHFGMILQVAQFYNALERYDAALEQLDYWFCVSTEEARKQAEVWVLKASLHVQKDEYREALAAITEAISIAEDPPEAWFRLKLGMELELEQFRDAAETLKLLVRMDPDRKEYWIQLSGTYMELDNGAEAMAALRLAFRRGLLNRGTEFIQLAGLLQELKAPRPVWTQGMWTPPLAIGKWLLAHGSSRVNCKRPCARTIVPASFLTAARSISSARQF
ncbi:MAG: tetratricopeptide repeat protein [Wenzhouxiangellaceae bacterium]